MNETIKIKDAWDYTEYGKITFRMRGKGKSYECPPQFKMEYDKFNKTCIERKYSPQGFLAVISGLKNYMNFLYQNHFISQDISRLLPKVRIMRNSFIPSVWKTEDVKKLLESIDRGNPTGKRDYAILLTVVRLGLRVSDIRALRLSNLNYYAENKTATRTPYT